MTYEQARQLGRGRLIYITSSELEFDMAINTRNPDIGTNQGTFLEVMGGNGAKVINHRGKIQVVDCGQISLYKL